MPERFTVSALHYPNNGPEELPTIDMESGTVATATSVRRIGLFFSDKQDDRYIIRHIINNYSKDYPPFIELLK